MGAVIFLPVWVCLLCARGHSRAHKVAPCLDGALLGQHHRNHRSTANHCNKVGEEALAVVFHKQLARLLRCETDPTFLRRKKNREEMSASDHGREHLCTSRLLALLFSRIFILYSFTSFLFRLSSFPHFDLCFCDSFAALLAADSCVGLSPASCISNPALCRLFVSASCLHFRVRS